MRLLLDSHILLWFDDPTGLHATVRREIDESERAVLSVVSVWELTFKQTIGKLHRTGSILNYAKACNFELLAITPEHAQMAGELPLHHRDPFDRMLVAQAMLENLTLVTRDRTLQQYGVPVLLA